MIRRLTGLLSSRFVNWVSWLITHIHQLPHIHDILYTHCEHICIRFQTQRDHWHSVWYLAFVSQEDIHLWQTCLSAVPIVAFHQTPSKKSIRNSARKSATMVVIIKSMFGNVLQNRYHDDVIKWKHFPCYWPFVWRIYRSPVTSPHASQWHGALTFSLIYVWKNGRVNNREAGDLRCYRAHYDVTVMQQRETVIASLGKYLC